MKTLIAVIGLLILVGPARAGRLDRYAPPPKLDLDVYSRSAEAPRPEMMLAQVNPANPLPDPVPVAPAATTPAPTTTPTYLYPLSPTFGPKKAWQIAFDYNPMVGACIGRDFTDGDFLGGPCHNGVVAARNGVPIFATAFGVLYNANHGMADYQFMAGGNLFGLGAAIANDALNLGIDAPPWVQKLGQVAYVYYGFGHRFNTDPNNVANPQTITFMLTYKFGSVPAADAAAQTILKSGL